MAGAAEPMARSQRVSDAGPRVSDAGMATAADGTRLAWRSVGDGPPLVLANGVSTTDTFWVRLRPAWARRWRVITWDYKGHGDSEPARSEAGTELSSLADDLRRVMDAAGVERAPLVGFSMGSQVVIEACRHFPDRIAAVVSLLGPARRMLDTAFRGRGPWIERGLRALPDRAVPALHRVAKVALRLPGAYRAGRLFGFYGEETSALDVAQYIDHFDRFHPLTVVRIVRSAARHDTGDLLPGLVLRLGVPLLVVTGRHDAFAPADLVGVPIWATASGSRLVVLADGTHGSLFGHAHRIERVVEEFFADVVDPAHRPP